ncbi:PIN domain-containing protein [Candidatus Saccharibacteria bacterium]|nr:PIN domain-containing protein [Candidatus Saccharibacteria bacterium]
MEASLDTNVILRYLWDDIPGQCAKVKKLFSDPTQTLAVSDLVIAEVIFNLQTKKVPRASIVSFILTLYEMPNIVPNPFITDTVLPFFESHPALSFVDCYAAFEAEKTHTEPLYTFDRRLANQHPSAKHL